MVNTHAIYVDKLNPEYRSVFKQISDYVMTANMDEIKNEEILSEVLDTFLSAQEEGKSVEQVVGSDLKTFCQQLCSEKSVKNYILYFFELLHPVFCLFLAFCLFDLVGFLSESDSVGFLTYRSSTSLSAFLVGGLIWIIAGCVSNFFLKRIMFRYPRKYKLLSVLIKCAAIAAILAVFILLFKDTETEGTYLWLALTCCAGFLIIHRIVTRESRRYKKENRISWMELAGASTNVSDDMEKMELKRFEKLNKKKRKKNEPELSFDEFLDHEEKECHKWDKKPGFFAGMAIGGSILGVAVTFFLSGFEHFSDFLIMLGLLLAVEGCLMFALYKLTDAGTRARIGWIRSKRERKEPQN